MSKAVACGIAFLLMLTLLIAGTISAAAATYAGPEYCKPCHRAIYDSWKTTSHSRAIDILIARNQSTEKACLECHTTGFKTEGTYALLNVTCESCHGAGGDHINATTPEQKKAAIVKSYNASVCGVCHQMEHYPYYEEWKNSSHARAIEDLKLKKEESNIRCQKCHTAIGLIVASQGKEFEAIVNPDPITCQGCHEPHKLETRLQVKLLCPTCHNSEGAKVGQVPLHSQSEMWGTSKHGLAGVTCADCHRYTRPYNSTSKAPAETGHTFKPPIKNPEKCGECHNGVRAPWQTVEQSTAQINQWQNAVKTALGEAETKLRAANDSIQANKTAIDAANLSRVMDKYNQSKFDIDLVKADKSYGVHNNPKALQMLNESKALSDEIVTVMAKVRQAGTPGSEILITVAAIAAMVFALRRH